MIVGDQRCSGRPSYRTYVARRWWPAALGGRVSTIMGPRSRRGFRCDREAPVGAVPGQLPRSGHGAAHRADHLRHRTRSVGSHVNAESGLPQGIRGRIRGGGQAVASSWHCPAVRAGRMVINRCIRRSVECSLLRRLGATRPDAGSATRAARPCARTGAGSPRGGGRGRWWGPHPARRRPRSCRGSIRRPSPAGRSCSAPGR